MSPNISYALTNPVEGRKEVKREWCDEVEERKQ
jgi:hypothetical protein